MSNNNKSTSTLMDKSASARISSANVRNHIPLTSSVIPLIQSSPQAKSGGDTGKGGFSARAQSAADTNANTSGGGGGGGRNTGGIGSGGQQGKK